MIYNQDIPYLLERELEMVSEKGELPHYEARINYALYLLTYGKEGMSLEECRAEYGGGCDI